MRRLVWLLLVTATASAAQSTDSPRADQLLAEARETYTQQGPEEALPQFEKALAMFRDAHDARGEAVTLGYVANCLRRVGKLAQALELGQKALAAKEKLGDRSEIGKTHNQLGLIDWDLANYPQAIKEFQTAIEIAKGVGDLQMEGSAVNNLGLVYDERGDYRESLPLYQRAVELHRKTHFERGEADTLGNIGGVSLQLGKFREALDYYRQALVIDQKLGFKPGQTIDLGNIAACLRGMGQIDDSLKTFDQTLQMAQRAGLQKEEADWRRGKGDTLAGLGRYDEALQEYGKAQETYERSGLKRELVDSLNDAGHVYELLGDMPSADKAFRRAMGLAQNIGNAAGVTTSTIALGDLERRRKQYDAADADFSSALESARNVGDTGRACEALIDRSINDLNRNRLVSAAASAAEAAKIADASGNKPAMAVAAFVQAEIIRAQGDSEQALLQYSAAENLQRELRDPELDWRILFGRGQALETLNKNQEAVAAYQTSIEVIERTRSAIAEERFRAGYIEERFQVYVALVELLLKLGKPLDALYYSEKLRARAYFDQVGRRESSAGDSALQHRLAEVSGQLQSLRTSITREYATKEKERRGEALEGYSRELEQAQAAYQELLDKVDGASGPIPVPAPLEIQKSVPRGTALLEYVVGKQTLSILTVTKDSVNGFAVQVSAENLSSRTALLRDLISARKATWVEPGAGLKRLLVDPVKRAGYLGKVQRLVVVPDGVLNYVPFAALPTGPSRFLGDDFVITYLPAAAALTAIRRSGAGNGSLLALAPSVSRLPNASAEVQSVGQMFPQGSLVLDGNKATKTLLKTVAGQYDYIHLATHGSLNRNAPWLSALQLQPDDQSDGRLEVHEVLDLKLHARLVTLSACETALGSGYFTDTPAGDEFVGMTRAFLGAGSDSVLASLWAVNDESTRLLMVKFYRYLRRFEGSEALARAQRDLRQASPRYRAPYYWAPFVLVGNAN